VTVKARKMPKYGQIFEESRPIPDKYCHRLASIPETSSRE
jgi:hypothetical protein